MTPAVGWTEHDYYRASRAARRACERRAAQQQIQGVLEEVDAKWGTAEDGNSGAVASISSSPPFLPRVASSPPPQRRAREQTTGPGATFTEAARRGQRRTV